MELLRVIHGNGIAVFFFLIGWSVCSSIPHQVKTLPHMTSNVKEVSGKSYDYIIVGGGTTGCPLAATLSERFSVLLVERGGSPYENPIIMDKAFSGLTLLQTDEFSSAAQSIVSEDGVPNFRGRILGGSSAINGGFYSRASENYVKKFGWDVELVKDAYKWVESRIVFKPQLTPWQTQVRFSFPEAGVVPYNGFKLEHKVGTKVGGSIFDEHGKRHSSADLLKAGNPENITVLFNATVQDVIFLNNGGRAKKIAHGIRFIKSGGESNEIHEAYLNQQPEKSYPSGDVILAAGALASPQILMLSGIGPYEHLKSFNLPLVVDSKQVGHGMKDNPAVRVLVESKPQKRQTETPQVVATTDDLKIILQTGVVSVSYNETRVPIAAKLAFPASKGKLELNNTDPRKNPLVKFNYLAKEEDSRECIRSIKLLQRIKSTKSIALFWGTEQQKDDVRIMSTSEDELRKFCKENVRTYNHFHGGCRVGSVVDKNYKVYGVKGLRVVDGSTFLESPGTNPMATLLMLGRYQGIKILEERKTSAKF